MSSAIEKSTTESKLDMILGTWILTTIGGGVIGCVGGLGIGIICPAYVDEPTAKEIEHKQYKPDNPLSYALQYGIKGLGVGFGWPIVGLYYGCKKLQSFANPRYSR